MVFFGQNNVNLNVIILFFIIGTCKFILIFGLWLDDVISNCHIMPCFDFSH